MGIGFLWTVKLLLTKFIPSPSGRPSTVTTPVISCVLPTIGMSGQHLTSSERKPGPCQYSSLPTNKSKLFPLHKISAGLLSEVMYLKSILKLLDLISLALF
uniref:Uncharacterized protein n=1 Tax=Cacopsylla melanoneura TaxID=428564 RepID=A0A8D9AC40_9HEMI